MSPDPPPPAELEAPRRTSLAAERTWLAWWRTGLTAAAAALGIGRVAPELLDGRDWPYVAIGAGYAALAVALVLLGGVRHRTLARALREGGFEELPDRWLTVVTIAGGALAAATLVLVLAGL